MIRRRHPVALAALTLPAVLLTGCLGAAREEVPSPSYLVTDLEGGTAAPDTFQTPDPTPAATKRPKGAKAAKNDPTESATDDADDGAPTGAELVSRVGGPAGELDSVRITIGDGTTPPDLEADVAYGDEDDFDATVQFAPEQPELIFRRLDDTFYAGTSAGLEVVDPADPRVATVAGGIVPALLVWNPLLDLRAALEGAEGIAEGGPDELDGQPVTSYTFTLNLDELPRPSLIVPDDVTGTAQVTLSLGDDELPVRLQFEAGASGAIVVVGYSEWGVPVDIEAP